MGLLLGLLACQSSGGLNDDTAETGAGQGLCAWVCDDEARLWVTDDVPSESQAACEGYAEEQCDAVWGAQWLEARPDEVCCFQVCAGSGVAGQSSTPTTDAECAAAFSEQEGCSTVLALYSCDAY